MPSSISTPSSDARADRGWCPTWVARSSGVLLLGGSALAQSLVNGGVVSGTLATPGEHDTYTFGARRGDWFELRLVDGSASGFVPELEVYNPRGTRIGTHASADVAVIDTLEVEGGLSATTPAGTYTVVVSDADGSDGPWDYELRFVLVPGASAGGELLDGVTLVGEIELGELDSYTFTTAAGVPVTGTVSPLPGGTLVLRAEEFGAGGRSAGTGGTFQFSMTSSPGGTHTLVVSDGSATATGTGRYSIVVHGVAAAPPCPPSVSWPAEHPLDPLLLDVGGHSGLGPRIGDPAEPFNVALDCTRAGAPSSYALILSAGHRAATSSPWGWIYVADPRLARELGQHHQSLESWFPQPAGFPLPNDLALVGLSYTVQGVCGGFNGGLRLSSAITQTIGG